MVNLSTALNPILQSLLKFYGLRSQTIEIQAGTVVHFWAPNHIIETYKNQANQVIKSSNHVEKPTLVFLHDFAATGVLTWLLQIMAFESTHEVFVPDLLFFGGSTTDRTERSPVFQAECLTKGLKLLGVKRCAVVGCSYGEIVGSKMAAMEPEFVTFLVLSNSNFAITESQSEEAFNRVGVRSWQELMLPETVEGLKKLLGVVVYKRPWFPDWAYKHFLQEIYFASGEEDKIFTVKIVQQTKSELGDKATLNLIKKAGHLAHLERPFVYNRNLKKILTSV
ncbi:uncharacterized protein LOC133799201 isoform X2 [Humulus lupulus]|uniref:uncharacterized protein LOC133799201 isoform X2 n=1 Tax=Humulus lupulus TaxID=3486 RepID=UPI002B4103A5|nr:uncharacterized protein LOC133799201 isoform X2 [Humulus lupulus]